MIVTSEAQKHLANQSAKRKSTDQVQGSLIFTCEQRRNKYTHTHRICVLGPCTHTHTQDAQNEGQGVPRNGL